MPVWNGRLSPVFDVARRLLLVDLVNGAETARREWRLQQAAPPARVRRLHELGVDVLICGAISRPLQAMMADAGVRVFPQTCGAADDVLRAFASGQLDDDMFLMPGCCGRRRRLRGRHGRRRRSLGAPGSAR